MERGGESSQVLSCRFSLVWVNHNFNHKNDQFWRYIIYGQSLRRKKIVNIAGEKCSACRHASKVSVRQSISCLWSSGLWGAVCKINYLARQKYISLVQKSASLPWMSSTGHDREMINWLWDRQNTFSFANKNIKY